MDFGSRVALAGGAAQGHDGGDVHAVEGRDELVGRLALLGRRHGVLLVLFFYLDSIENVPLSGSRRCAGWRLELAF